jgi:hypothetical protein
MAQDQAMGRWNRHDHEELGMLETGPKEKTVERSSITRLPTARADLFAFRVDGRIHKPDIEAMARIVDEGFERLGEIDMLIVITRWDGIDLGAAADPKMLGTQARANAHVRKYAVVGAPGWAKAMINLSSPLTPVEEKTFDLAEEARAWAWVDEGRPAPAVQRRA